MGERVAAIDCGTNSTRLLVAELDGAGPFVTLDRRMRITRLGQGVDEAGRLHDDAIARTLDVLREYRGVIDDLGVEPSRVRVAATSAARDAANRDAFFDPAETVLSVRPELLSGEEEGRLSFAGATAELDPSTAPWLIVDIGGGSTEFSVGDADGFAGSFSADVGCVRLTERYIESDPPAPEELLACLSVSDEWLGDVQRELPGIAGVSTFVGLAGTVTTVAAVELGLATYDRDAIHHFRLTHDAAEDVFRTLVTEKRDDRLHNPGLEAERVDTIVGGLCVLVAVFRHFGFDECLVSEADVLDGLVSSQRR